MIDGAKCVEPDWEDQIKRGRDELEVVKRLKRSLVDFISMIGPQQLVPRTVNSSASSIAELLGLLEIEIIERENDIQMWMKRLEDKK